MQNSFRCLTGSKIVQIFPHCLPCNCYLDSNRILENPRYSVDVNYGACFGDGKQLVESIVVECDCCHKRKRSVVDQYDVYNCNLLW